MKRIALILVIALVGLGFSAAKPSIAHADNAAVAVNTKDGSSVFRFAFKVKKVMGDVVEEENAAVAFASCTSCRTMAIAVEIVLIMDDASVINPTNLALAINYECTLCETFAVAIQFVLTTGGPVHFTAEGNRLLAQIKHEFRELGEQDLSFEEFQARIDELSEQLRQVLETELVPAGKSGDDDGDEGEAPPPPPAPEPPPAETTPTTTETTPTETTETTPTETTTTP
jgi:putative peptide zinc metalloprotease protein